MHTHGRTKTRSVAASPRAAYARPSRSGRTASRPTRPPRQGRITSAADPAALRVPRAGLRPELRSAAERPGRTGRSPGGPTRLPLIARAARGPSATHHVAVQAQTAGHLIGTEETEGAIPSDGSKRLRARSEALQGRKTHTRPRRWFKRRTRGCQPRDPGAIPGRRSKGSTSAQARAGAGPARLRGGAGAARLAHNQENACANHAPATTTCRARPRVTLALRSSKYGAPHKRGRGSLTLPAATAARDEPRFERRARDEPRLDARAIRSGPTARMRGFEPRRWRFESFLRNRAGLAVW